MYIISTFLIYHEQILIVVNSLINKPFNGKRNMQAKTDKIIEYPFENVFQWK